MKTTLLLALIIILNLGVSAQTTIVSKFTWSTSSVLTADVGPNGISASTSAVVTGNALNPGTPLQNIDLVLPGSTFDLEGIDINIDFRREESEGYFFSRGSNFDFGMTGGNLMIKFTLNNGAGTTVVSNTNIMAIPDDHVFHTYRFQYDPTTGIGRVWMDGVVRYTYNGTAGQTMNWTSAGNMVIGRLIDASGRNVAVFDNMQVVRLTLTTLPVKLLAFDAQQKDQNVQISWATTNESNIEAFIVERSADAERFTAIQSVSPKGSFTSTTAYQITDKMPLVTGYYRLKTLDKDGAINYSAIKKVSFSQNATAVTFSVYPNPAVEQVNVRFNNKSNTTYRYSVLNASGNTLKTASVQVAKGMQQITIELGQQVAPGMLIIRLENEQTKETETLRVIKK